MSISARRAGEETCAAQANRSPGARRRENSPLVRRLLAVAAVLLAMGALALSVDLPISRWAAAAAFPGFVRKLIEIGEIFGHGLGVLVIIAAAYHFDPRRRRALPRMMLIAYGGGLAANLCKFMVVRCRPRGFDLASHDVWNTFLAWSPPWTRSSVNESFPSAHTATAVAFAIALTCVYPHARRFLVVAAAMVGVQRIASGAHFPSDVCCGAAVGSLAAAAMLSLPVSAAWLRNLHSDSNALDVPALKTIGHGESDEAASDELPAAA